MGLGITQFDLVVLGLLAISAIVGFARGAVLETISLVALVAAAVAAVYGLPFAAPFAHRLIHIEWLATVLALIVVFIVVFSLIRLIGAMLARYIHETYFIGTLDRSLGLAVGLIRGLLALGILNLMFNAATPKDLQPHWIVGSSTWPLAQDMGRLVSTLTPQGLDLAARLKPAFDHALHDAKHDAVDDRLKSEGYDARQRKEIEDLVEKSR